MVYLLIFFFLLFMSFSWHRWSAASQRRLFSLCVMILFALSGLRSRTIGIDTAGGYYDQYLTANAGGRLSWVEPGWRLLNYISVNLHWGYPGILSLASLMALLPTAYTIFKKCKNPCYGLFIYYGMYMVLYSFNIMRQCVGVGWVLLGVYFFDRKRYFPMLTAVAIAVSFHTSALVFCLIVVFSVVKLRYTTVACFFVASFAFGLFLNKSVSFVLGKYEHYLNVSGYAGFRNNLFLPIVFTLAINAFFLAIFALRANHPMSNIWYKTTILGIIVMNLTLRLGQGTRVVLYFSQTQAISMPLYIDSLKDVKNKRVVRALYFIFLLANFLRILLGQKNSVIPYRTFWMDG